MFFPTCTAVVVGPTVSTAIVAVVGYCDTATNRPEALALGELDDYAARPRPCAGFETLDCRPAECPRRTSRARPIHRRIARKLTWV